MAEYTITNEADGTEHIIVAPDDVPFSEVAAKAREYFAAQETSAPKERSTLDNVARFLETNPVSRAGRGMMKPFLGAAQKLANLTPLGDDFNRYVSEEERGQQGIKKQSTALGLPVGTFGMGPQGGIDIADMVGQGMGYAVPLSKIMPFKGGAFARAGNAAVQGAAAGASMPVTNTENLSMQDLATGRQKDSLWGETAKNAGLGFAIGGVASPLVDLGISGAAAGMNKLGQGAKSIANRFAPPSTFSVDINIVRSLQKNGIDWRMLSDDVKKSLRKEAAEALKVGGKLDDAALARLADFKNLGVTPLRSWVTRDPSQFTNEANLAKVQANTGGGRLVNAQVQGNAKLTQVLDNLGANKAGSRYAAGEGNIALIQAADKAKEGAVDSLYNQARVLAGGDIRLDARKALSDMVAKLESEGNLPALGQFGSVVNDIIGGKFPLSVGNAQGLLKTISRASTSPDGNVRYAMGQLRNAIENANPADQLGADAMAAFAKARSEARQRFQWQESSPAIKAALGDYAPDKFFERFILGGNVTDIAQAMKVMTGQMKQENRALIAQHLRERAAKGASQGDANAIFNQNQYNDALRAIGKEKLALFFSPDEVQRLQMLGRASYNMKAQPIASAVNNSNTASSAFKILDSIASKIPFGKAAVGDVLSSVGQARLEAQAVKPQISAPYKPIDPEQIRQLLGPVAPLTAVGLLGS